LTFDSPSIFTTLPLIPGKLILYIVHSGEKVNNKNRIQNSGVRSQKGEKKTEVRRNTENRSQETESRIQDRD
jgi:hypothetical protein